MAGKANRTRAQKTMSDKPPPAYAHHLASTHLTLRDYFAAKAIQGYLACPDAHGTTEEFTEAAYKQADAMLKERAK